MSTEQINDIIIQKICMVRGQKVMLDRDLAELYGVETKRLKEQVNRNPARFPPRYMFELTRAEYKNLRSQNATLSAVTASRYLPYAFTEHGVLMLANVLKSEKAIAMSLKIIDVFVQLREMLTSHKTVLLKLDELETRMAGQDKNIETLFVAIRQLIGTPNRSRPRVGFRRSSERNPEE